MAIGLSRGPITKMLAHSVPAYNAEAPCVPPAYNGPATSL